MAEPHMPHMDRDSPSQSCLLLQASGAIEEPKILTQTGLLRHSVRDDRAPRHLRLPAAWTGHRCRTHLRPDALPIMEHERRTRLQETYVVC